MSTVIETEASERYVRRGFDELRLNVALAATEECGSCSGDGGEHEDVDCADCGGTGETECVLCDGDVDCESCDGTGQEACEDCHGSGTTSEWVDCGYCEDGKAVDGEEVADRVEALLTALSRLSFDGFNVLAADWCCMSCSYAAVDSTRPLIGFHEQDVEASRLDRGVHLFHDFVVGGGDPDTNRDTALAALADAGLTIEWDRDATNRILVTV
ncbi:hypothetical protein DVS28_b0151 (plasmid) [Euzebya pacifica]|uniref:DUF6891 domain-containing protein n=1 Tax=Euzebya pacifica TaxID=1608957 RepID=A0A346Y624_9ACTN|nr:hypothetical protein [Euzebya pacifica]AXV09921.1 hypothetical protein DVS28_b0151 [Euzebya pacifica]